MAVQIRADNYTQTDRQKEFYSDFLPDLNPHPQTGDIVRYVNENAVKRSIRNLVRTNAGERLFAPTVGGNIDKFLFEPLDNITASSIKDQITQVISNHEPRCKLMSVDVIPRTEIDGYIINVNYMIINSQTVQQTSITLYRVR
jgi:phage baseplate assembly protein W